MSKNFNNKACHPVPKPVVSVFTVTMVTGTTWTVWQPNRPEYRSNFTVSSNDNLLVFYQAFGVDLSFNRSCGTSMFVAGGGLRVNYRSYCTSIRTYSVVIVHVA